MITTSRIYYITKSIYKEDYIFLQYNTMTKSLFVIRGFFAREMQDSPWSGNEKLFSIDGYLKNFPELEEIIKELKTEIDNKLAGS